MSPQNASSPALSLLQASSGINTPAIHPTVHSHKKIHPSTQTKTQRRLKMPELMAEETVQETPVVQAQDHCADIVKAKEMCLAEVSQ